MNDAPNEPENTPRVAVLTPEFIASLNDDTAHLFIVIAAWRAELIPFMEKLEHGYYPPGTPENAKLDLYIITWEQMKYGVIGIPLRDRWIADRVAEETGTRLADGVPCMFTGDGRPISRFPVHSRRTFNLEPKHAHKGPAVGDVVEQDLASGNLSRNAMTDAIKKTFETMLKPKDGPL